jgi:hypothetical protein
MPSEKSVFTTRVEPVSPPQRPARPNLPGPELVEAPGTAPGSTTLIPRTVYRHSRRTGRTYIGRPAAHGKRPGFARSVILHQVDPDGVFTLPLEGKAPGAVDMNGVAGWLALQSVEVETRGVHFLGPCGSVQAGQPCLQALMQIRPNSRSIAAVPQGGEQHGCGTSESCAPVRYGFSSVKSTLTGVKPSGIFSSREKSDTLQSGNQLITS